MPKKYDKNKIIEKRNYRKNNGLCTRCGQKLDECGFITCSSCRVKGRKLNHAMSERRKEQHLCLNCGAPLDRNGSLCSTCRDLRNERVREDRKYFKEIGICPRCKKNKILGDEKSCPECQAYSYSLITPKRMENREHYNEIQKEYKRKLYEKRKDQGICTICGGAISDKRYSTCNACREKQAENKRRRNSTLFESRDERVKNGICFFCNNHIVDGYKVCQKHLDMCREKLKYPNCIKYRENAKKMNDIFFIKKARIETKDGLQDNMDNSLELSKEIPSGEERR